MRNEVNCSHRPLDSRTLIVRSTRAGAETATDLSTEDLEVAVGEDSLVLEATRDRHKVQKALSEAVTDALCAALEYADTSQAGVFAARGAEETSVRPGS